ncbi:MAG TPA: hypothetical protein VGK84_07075 [Candidatus Tumulicola sp.]|jgi:hypothetical protein
MITGMHAIVYSKHAERVQTFLHGGIGTTLKTFAEFGVETIQPVADRGWGLLARVRLPGGDEFGIYEARHASPSDRSSE